MGKHSKAHICVNKTGTDETSEYEGRNPGTARSWGCGFSVLHSHCTREAGYSSAATVLLKNITGRERDGAPEAQHRFDWQLHRENVSQHLKPRNSNKTFRIYQHISLLFFMRKLAFSSTWCSHQSRMIFTRIPWISFAWEEQSLFLFYGLISIKPCCWLATLCTVFENQYRTDTVKKKKLNPTELVFLLNWILWRAILKGFVHFIFI